MIDCKTRPSGSDRRPGGGGGGGILPPDSVWRIDPEPPPASETVLRRPVPAPVPAVATQWHRPAPGQSSGLHHMTVMACDYGGCFEHW